MAATINESDNSKQILSSLANELKYPLYAIARYAELQDKDSPQKILHTAEAATSLIDSYLLVARAEYGQVQLDLEPIGTGSILHEATNSLRSWDNKTELVIQNDAHDPVMTNKTALVSGLVSCAHVLNEARPKKVRGKLIFRSFKTREGRVGIGIFDSRTNITANDIRMALSLYGKAHMALPAISQKGATSLAIADGLFRAVGGSLEVRKMDKLRGLATILPKSEQLSLV